MAGTEYLYVYAQTFLSAGLWRTHEPHCLKPYRDFAICLEEILQPSQASVSFSVVEKSGGTKVLRLGQGL